MLYFISHAEAINKLSTLIFLLNMSSVRQIMHCKILQEKSHDAQLSFRIMRGH